MWGLRRMRSIAILGCGCHESHPQSSQVRFQRHSACLSGRGSRAQPIFSHSRCLQALAQRAGLLPLGGHLRSRCVLATGTLTSGCRTVLSRDEEPGSEHAW